ncbi:hypothetical protein [Herbiconiux sp. YIM B11900]|uniref:hypothetical protein n=1 Tax=Herbiconiux sp. YIM B11900 TaxID=3404131 RepID=UPI003F8302F2
MGALGYQEGATFTLLRCDPPPALEGKYDWGWATPLLFKALNSPRTGERFPRHPDDRRTISAGVFGYWNSLAALLSFSFGWRDHARGLRWWLDQGQPVDDSRFALISEVWGFDRTLGSYVEWVHAKGPNASTHLGEVLNGRPEPLSPLWQSRISQLREAMRDRERAGRHSYPHGLHLEAGTHVADATPNEKNWVDFRPHGMRENRACLILPGLDGWYNHLVQAGSSLPNLTSKAWRIEVIAQSVGILGVFRRSWDTGLWFAGPHALHIVGN